MYLLFGYLIKINLIKKYKKEIIVAILIITILSNLCLNISNRKFKIYFIDVGQGDSCLLVTPENIKILVDRRGK